MFKEAKGQPKIQGEKEENKRGKNHVDDSFFLFFWPLQNSFPQLIGFTRRYQLK